MFSALVRKSKLSCGWHFLWLDICLLSISSFHDQSLKMHLTMRNQPRAYIFGLNAMRRLVTHYPGMQGKQWPHTEGWYGMVGKSKLTALLNKDCSVKSYSSIKSLHEVRKPFRVRTQMTKGFRENFLSMYKSGSTKCEGCDQVLDTQTHATECPA
jgi:hypothetical protein